MARPRTRARDGLKPYRVCWGSPNNLSETVDYATAKDAKDCAARKIQEISMTHGKYDRALSNDCQMAVMDVRGIDLDKKSESEPYQRALATPVPFVVRLWKST